MLRDVAMTHSLETAVKPHEIALKLLTTAAAGGDVGPFVAELGPEIERIIKKLFKSWEGKLPATDLSDVVQDVTIKLLQKPPTGAKDKTIPIDGNRALSLVLAWVKKTTIRHLVDLGRKRKEELLPDEEYPDQKKKAIPPTTSGPSSAAQMEARLDLSWCREVIARDYPRGLEYFELWMETPDASGEERAEALGISKANAYAIRCRIIKTLSRHNGPNRRKK